MRNCCEVYIRKQKGKVQGFKFVLSLTLLLKKADVMRQHVQVFYCIYVCRYSYVGMYVSMIFCLFMLRLLLSLFVLFVFFLSASPGPFLGIVCVTVLFYHNTVHMVFLPTFEHNG